MAVRLWVLAGRFTDVAEVDTDPSSSLRAAGFAGPALRAECADDAEPDELVSPGSAAAFQGQATIARPSPVTKTADVRRALVDGDSTAHLLEEISGLLPIA
ncbi:hypothetical protein BST42_13085 [Mycolicibacterium rhodesiae]|uniref:Uncharacterized protein n=1 Tax=Mycolicibacterium rhodesiae TaxID=36814 RepID=A0A1X0IVD2_MYCRH|nr:hypothetical protein BST42_13085 [Mycolicibacterium rhodesiae]